MTEIVVRVEGLGKRYRLGGHDRPAYKSLRESLMAGIRAPIARLRGGAARERPRDLWALKDVSFEVRSGEVLGIIGRNGAGKSTLLKVLSRITEPTEGLADVYGRVGSLLEVGTGFHPELTGRENVYLNGAILGMARHEIDRRFDEIVAFAELKPFLDTPVKRYSSGMYMRLAFSVAAHLEPEIFVIDEVLAVGDANFQRKCLGKMGEVAREGRTVLFVSHNMSAILNLCSRTLLLESGRVTAQGPTDEMVARYLHDPQVSFSNDLTGYTQRQGRGRVVFTTVMIGDAEGQPLTTAISGSQLCVKLGYRSNATDWLRNCRASIAVTTLAGDALFICSTELASTDTLDLPPEGVLQCEIPNLPLNGGEYLLTLFLEVNREVEDFLQSAVPLHVTDGDFFGTGRQYPPGWEGKGVLVAHQWSVQ